MKSAHYWISGITTLIAGIVLIGWLTWPYLHPSPQQAFEMGVEAAEHDDLDALIRSADRLHGIAAYTGHEHLLRGIYCLKTHRPVEALKEVAALNPEGDLRELTLLTAGEALYRTDRLSDAYRMFAMVTAESPGHVKAHRWLAAIAYDLGAMNQAIDELEIVTRLQPDDFRSFVLKANILFDEEQYPAATTAYRDALAANPPESSRIEILVDLARSQIRSRDYADALQNLAQAHRTAESLALQAECESHLGNRDEAWNLIQDATALSPKDPTVLRVQGRMELEDGQLAAARDTYRRLLAQDPHDHESRHQLSQALRSLGITAEADAESLKSAHSIELKVKLAALNLDAIKLPTNAEIREQIASLCDELGKPLLAKSWRKAAIACRNFTQTPTKTVP